MTTLNSNPPCIVDESLAMHLSVFNWMGGKGRTGKYYMAHMNGRGNVYLHRYIFELENGSIPSGLQIDHKDQNPINNQSGNLRAVTRTVNHANRGKNKCGTSGYRGVHFCRKTGKWRARTRLGGTEKILGYFLLPIEAARRINQFYRENFPQCPPPNPV